MIGVTEAIGLTKTDRKQIGETKALRCTSDCSGALEFDKDGRIDYSRVCPAHMLVYAQKLTAEKLGVAMSDLAQYPLFADYETSATVPTRYEVAVDSLGSPMAPRRGRPAACTAVPGGGDVSNVRQAGAKSGRLCPIAHVCRRAAH